MRLVMTVLLLIVLPTALLSVLAGRSIQARELIFDRQLMQDATVRLDEVSSQMDFLVREAREQSIRYFRRCVLAGKDNTSVVPGQPSHTSVSEITAAHYLFLNPWGFLYPEDALGLETVDGSSPEDESVYSRLRRLIAARVAGERGRLMVEDQGRVYCLELLPDYHDLVAVIEWNLPAMQRELNRLLQAQSSLFLQFSVLSSDPVDHWIRGDRDDVRVVDSLGSPAQTVPRSRTGTYRHDGIIASRRLNPPLAHVLIGAVTVNVDEIQEAYRLQERLTVWGILLLAIVIITTAVILIRISWSQAQMARQRSEFMAGMSHDLRTPVAAMRVLAESLHEGRIRDQQRQHEFLGPIMTECDRLGNLIERVMFYFRQEHGAQQYAMTRLPLDSLCEKVVERFRRQTGERWNIRFHCKTAVPCVRADADAIEKMLVNLLDNAVKYGIRSERRLADQATAPPDIDVSLRTVEQRYWGRKWVVLSVRDWGDGISRHDASRIFKRFYRGQAAAHAHRGGFGLGLSLVNDIIRAHRGRIRVYNAPDGGAVFDVWLRGKASDNG